MSDDIENGAGPTDRVTREQPKCDATPPTIDAMQSVIDELDNARCNATDMLGSPFKNDANV